MQKKTRDQFQHLLPNLSNSNKPRFEKEKIPQRQVLIPKYDDIIINEEMEEKMKIIIYNKEGNTKKEK